MEVNSSTVMVMDVSQRLALAPSNSQRLPFAQVPHQRAIYLKMALAEVQERKRAREACLVVGISYPISGIRLIYADCCSVNGYCGSTNDFCQVGCQSAFGSCKEHNISIDGQCGANGKTCTGSTFGSQ